MLIEEGCVAAEVVEGRSNVIGVAWVGGAAGEQGKRS